MRRTKIVATIGPASRDPDTLARMVQAGMDVARLNFSHGNRELHAENAERVRAAASAAGRQVAILQDLPGPKLRIGALRDDIAELKPGDKLVLACGSDDVDACARLVAARRDVVLSGRANVGEDDRCWRGRRTGYTHEPASLVTNAAVGGDLDLVGETLAEAGRSLKRDHDRRRRLHRRAQQNRGERDHHAIRHRIASSRRRRKLFPRAAVSAFR